MQTEIDDKLRNSRVSVLTAVITAVAVNIIGVHVVISRNKNYGRSCNIHYYIFVVTYYSGFKTTISTDILARVLYDGRGSRLG